jgi:hypothetical protein
MAEIDETKIRTLCAEHYRRWKQNGASRDVFDSRVVRAAQLNTRVDWSVKIGVTLNRTLLWLVTVLFVASGHLAEAQQPKKIPRIGYLRVLPFPLSRPESRHSGKVCASVGT